MKNQLENPTCNSHVRPEDLMEEMGIKSNTYYRDVNFLNIEAIKDDDGKTWITIEDAERIKALRNYVQETGKRKGFEDIEDNEANLIVSENNSIQNNEDDIYVTPDEPTENINVDNLASAWEAPHSMQ
jgi:hypothetical protein